MDLKITQDENSEVCTYYFEDLIFTISHLGNLDLYWSVFSKRRGMDQISFTINNDCTLLYSLFSELHESISKNVIEGLSDDSNDMLEKRMYSSFLGLFEKDTITWHSDDEPFEESNFVTIKKVNDEFYVCFDKSKSGKRNFSIRYTNSGSRYAPFNIVFMQMFKKIINSKEKNNSK